LGINVTVLPSGRLILQDALHAAGAEKEILMVIDKRIWYNLKNIEVKRSCQTNGQFFIMKQKSPSVSGKKRGFEK